MAATAHERARSRGQSGEFPTRSVEYIVEGDGSTTVAQAIAAVSAEAGNTLDGLDLVSVSVEEIEGTNDFEAVARYGTRAGLEAGTEGDTRTAFSFGGTTKRITQSIATIASAIPAGAGEFATTPNFKGAIGVSSNGVEGVEVPDSQFAFTVTRYIAKASMTTAYKGTLFALTRKVNNAVFSVDGQTFQAGELLLVSVEGTERAFDWEVTYRFAAQQNETNIEIGDITISEKQGWDYLWVLYEEREDDAAFALISQPVAAYVERVIPRANFGALIV